jgi:hypothetical protein
MQVETSAQTRALAIQEIVVLILHQMDMRTLIAAQRICRTWKDLISGSHSLQEALFLRSVGENSENSARFDNPLLAEAFPWLFPLRNQDDAPSTSAIRHQKRDFILSDLAWLKDPAVIELFIRPEASWRQMLTHQPPLYRAGEFKINNTPFGFSWCQLKGTLHNDGIQMGPLFEWLIDRDRDQWDFTSWFTTWIPALSPITIIPPPRFKHSHTASADWNKMMKCFDIVLERGSHVACTTYEDFEDEGGEDLGLATWERLCSSYRAVGLTMSGLQMEEYNEGAEGWD